LAFGSSPEEQGPTLDVSASDAAAALPPPIDLPLPLLALAGSATTLVADVIMHPVDCVKILQQSDAGYGLSLAGAAAALWDRDGISGFYSGFVTYALSDAAGGALKFAVWETWKQGLPTPAESSAIASSESAADSLGAPSSSSSLFASLWFQWGYWFVGAALAFVASSFVIVPGEFVKNQLQMDYYDGLWDAVTGIASTRGLPGFFVGYDGVMYRDVPYTMLELGLYEVFKATLLRRKSSPGQFKNPPVIWDDLLAAALTGGITAFLTTPLDAVKTKLMVDAEYAGYSFAECFGATVEAHGFGSVFAGVVARVAWILPFTTIYLPTYDFLKRWMWRRYAAAQDAAAGNEGGASSVT
jgi:hypothetical protein